MKKQKAEERNEVPLCVQSTFITLVYTWWSKRKRRSIAFKSIHSFFFSLSSQHVYVCIITRRGKKKELNWQNDLSNATTMKSSYYYSKLEQWWYAGCFFIIILLLILLVLHFFLNTQCILEDYAYTHTQPFTICYEIYI